MTMDASFDWDSLSQAEGELCERIMPVLQSQPWAHALLSDINENGGIVRANKTRLFELRFASALHRAGTAPRYEIPGEAGSTLDFGFTHAGQPWRVELMRLEETAAALAATCEAVDENGISWSQRALSSNAEDPRQSEEGETLKAVQRICQKCERDGAPYKFPTLDGALHTILVDFQTFLNGGDVADRIHVALGGEMLAPVFRRHFRGRLISGVFHHQNAMHGAEYARTRVHFIGFVRERTYADDEFGRAIQFVANPNLFADAAAVQAAIATWPLQPVHVLNGS